MIAVAAFVLLLVLLTAVLIALVTCGYAVRRATTIRRRARWIATTLAICAGCLTIAVLAWAALPEVRVAARELAAIVFGFAVLVFFAAVLQGFDDAKHGRAALMWGWIGSVAIFLFALAVLSSPPTEGEVLHGPSLAILAFAPLLAGGARAVGLKPERRHDEPAYAALANAAIYIAVVFGLLAFLGPTVLGNRVSAWLGLVPASVGAVVCASGWASRRRRRIARREHDDVLARTRLACEQSRANHMTRFGRRRELSSAPAGAGSLGRPPASRWASTGHRVVLYAPPGWPAGRPLTARPPSMARALSIGLLPAAIPSAVLVSSVLGWSAANGSAPTTICLLSGLVAGAALAVGRTRYAVRAREAAATPALVALATLIGVAPWLAGSVVRDGAAGELGVVCAIVIYALIGIALVIDKARVELAELLRVLEHEPARALTPSRQRDTAAESEAWEDVCDQIVEDTLDGATTVASNPRSSGGGSMGSDLDELFDDLEELVNVLP